ncbi:FkbM family methyltransferase [Protofrankia symbiont of Coriaria ruscifolia]|uniref:FkbM family methyltransferase n=1 Tax=Candidatus Protofrankia californiensis TaxID=1839754 RepID=A0A1C3NXR1_9ACTN|nr:FkbM family methyltransferase [Protofrankia symbiont of Coriaria ruscifolia]SBW22340.1 FkbM family methyltransferase [Candidatus Protofrankia californiensis]
MIGSRHSAATMLSLRSAAERASHRVVLRRRLPAPFDQTRIYVSSEAGLKFLRPRLTGVDPVLLGLVGEVVRAGSTVWDIGANTGLFTFAAAATAGPGGTVLAVEPDTIMVNLLRRSSTLPGRRARIDVLPVAAAADPGVSRFCIAARNRATNHIEGFGGDQTGGVRAVQVVPTVTLDSLLDHFPAPDVLKVDVEGAERLVLEGGPRLLSETRPAVICEVAPANAGPVTQIFTEHGYQIFDASHPAGTRRPVDSAAWSTLALAAER